MRGALGAAAFATSAGGAGLKRARRVVLMVYTLNGDE
jgi:hypothetical protein